MTDMVDPAAGGVNNRKPGDETPDGRATWFGQFGYTGDNDEMVALRGGLGVARAQDVWAVLCGLRALENALSSQFDRTVVFAHQGQRPLDPARRLQRREYGALFDPTTGTWAQGRREIVLALTDVEDHSDGVFADEPLVPMAPATETA